jgi:DNA-binding response OmpR family regulator
MPKKILIIDDTNTDRKIVMRFLSKLGYENIIFAENGEDGVKMAASEKPDLVITDTNMPGIDGFETCRLIREENGKEKPKIIVMTGAIDAVDAVKARKAGADDYCVKTTDTAELLAAVKTLIGEA